MNSSHFHAFSDIAPQGVGVVSPPQSPDFYIDRPDVIDRLPTAEAQGALSDLRSLVEDIQASSSRATEKMFDEGKAADEAKTNFLVISDPGVASRMGDGHTLAEDNPEYIRRKASMEKAQARHRETIAKKEVLSQRFQMQKRLLTDIEAYIAAAGNLSAAPALKVKMPAADRLSVEVERIRNEIKELHAEKHAVNSAAYPSAEAKVRARAEIEALAEKGRPNVLRMIDHGPAEGIVWPNFIARSHIFGQSILLPGDVRHAGEDLPGAHLALTAWLFKDRMLEAILAEIDAASEDESALSTEARAAKLADLDARILDAERVECTLIRNAGGTVDYREDCDPRAVLGVDGPAPRRDD